MVRTKTEIVQVLLTKEQLIELKKTTTEADLSLSHYLRNLIASHLKEKKEQGSSSS